MELGQLFVDEGLVTAEQLATARDAQNGKRIDQSLIELGMVTEDDVLKAFSSEFGIPFLPPNQVSRNSPVCRFFLMTP